MRFDSPIKIAFQFAIDKERRTNTSIFIKYSIGSLVTKHFYHLIFKFKWVKALYRQHGSICFNLEQPHKRDCLFVALHLSLCGFEKNPFNQFGERTVSKIYIINSISSSSIYSCLTFQFYIKKCFAYTLFHLFFSTKNAGKKTTDISWKVECFFLKKKIRLTVRNYINRLPRRFMHFEAIAVLIHMQI